MKLQIKDDSLLFMIIQLRDATCGAREHAEELRTATVNGTKRPKSLTHLTGPEKKQTGTRRMRQTCGRPGRVTAFASGGKAAGYSSSVSV